MKVHYAERIVDVLWDVMLCSLIMFADLSEEGTAFIFSI
jgi:hypothetical protein